MKQKPLVAASFICGNHLNFKQDLTDLAKSRVDFIHFDVMDGVFVPRYGLYPEILSLIRKKTNAPVDVHMMTVDPEKYISIFADAGATYYVVHVEACTHLHQTLRLIKESGMKAGVAINPASPIDFLKYVMPELDLILIMAINPGIIGHKLIPDIINKIREAKKMVIEYDRPEILIEIDGGVNWDSAKDMIESGANLLVCGTSSIYNQKLPLSRMIVKFKKMISKYTYLAK